MVAVSVVRSWLMGGWPTLYAKASMSCFPLEWSLVLISAAGTCCVCAAFSHFLRYNLTSTESSVPETAEFTETTEATQVTLVNEATD